MAAILLNQLRCFTNKPLRGFKGGRYMAGERLSKGEKKRPIQEQEGLSVQVRVWWVKELSKYPVT